MNVCNRIEKHLEKPVEFDIIGGDTYIGGEILEEDYGRTEIISAGIAERLVVLSGDGYFVLSGNHEISKEASLLCYRERKYRWKGYKNI